MNADYKGRCYKPATETVSQKMPLIMKEVGQLSIYIVVGFVPKFLLETWVMK